MKLCMAAPYDIQSPQSWSGTPLSLYSALSAAHTIDTMNLSGAQTDLQIKSHFIRYLDPIASLKARRPISRLGLSQMNPLYSAELHKRCHSVDYDALIEFGGFLPGKDLPPYYVYTDSSHDLTLSYYRQYGKLPFYHGPEALYEIKHSAEFVRKIYLNAAGVFCMSSWLAESMVRDSGVTADRVHVVYAGANWHGVSIPTVQEPRDLPDGDCHLLLTGVSYLGKGVDIACAAVDELNRSGSRRYVLHVCGVKEDFDHNENVINHSFVDKVTLCSLLQQCNVFVLPSRYDCFGISFVEAMTFGLPCVGRNICAMPEIIDSGVNGELVDGDDPIQLAELIDKICADPVRYREYSAAAIEKAKIFTWEAVADRINEVLKNN